MKICVITLAILLAGCPTPGPAPTPDVRDTAARDASGFDANFQATCLQACANLRGIGCSDGLDPKCVDVCEHGKDVTRMLDQEHLNCLAEAADLGAARDCKSVSCK